MKDETQQPEPLQEGLPAPAEEVEQEPDWDNLAYDKYEHPENFYDGP